jgi:hypothetical protein
MQMFCFQGTWSGVEDAWQTSSMPLLVFRMIARRENEKEMHILWKGCKLFGYRAHVLAPKIALEDLNDANAWDFGIDQLCGLQLMVAKGTQNT